MCIRDSHSRVTLVQYRRTDGSLILPYEKNRSQSLLICERPTENELPTTGGHTTANESLN